MPFPVAGSPINHPQYSGLLIPQIWSPRILEKFYESSVLEYIANSSWEGEIRNQGDTVNIRTRPNISISEHVKGQRMTSSERPVPAVVQLVIDRGLTWDFEIDDIDLAQADYDYMLDWTTDAATQMNVKVNEIILQEIPADVHSSNQGDAAGVLTGYFNLGAVGAPLNVTKNNVIDVISDWHVVLSEQNVPETDRWAVIPAWFKGLVQSNELRGQLVTGNDQELLRKGHIGNLFGFELFESNQLLAVEDGSGSGAELVTNLLFGHKSALTFASQLVNSRVIEDKEVWGRFCQGLNVFGFEVVKPEAMGLCYAKRGIAT